MPFTGHIVVIELREECLEAAYIKILAESGRMWVDCTHD